MVTFPIFVPSKGRATTSKLLPLLRESGLDNFVFVVEPQDEAAYRAQLPQGEILVLPKNNQGLAYVRQFVLDYAASQGVGWFWMMDDDISGFYKTVERKNKRIPVVEALEKAQRYFQDSDQIAQASLEYQQYAWSQTKHYALNGYCDVCVCIHAQRCKPLRFRNEVNLKLDRDFTLQVLASGFDTIRACKYSFACPKNGSNAGGLQPVYQADGVEKQNSLTMVRLWGEQICKFNEKADGRPDVKINWAYFKR